MPKMKPIKPSVSRKAGDHECSVDMGGMTFHFATPEDMMKFIMDFKQVAEREQNEKLKGLFSA